jgi:hypothetical protein
MGQHESAQMAQAGWSAKQILLHYYDAEPTLYSAPDLAPRAYLPLVGR